MRRGRGGVILGLCTALALPTFCAAAWAQPEPVTDAVPVVSGSV